MQNYFEIEKNKDQLLTVCKSWLNTPYRHHCAVKGLGCDCAHFIAKVLVELGLLKWKRGLIPDYPRGWHLHIASELFEETIEKRFNEQKIYFEKFTDKDFICGDIALFQYGKANSHGAFFIDGYFYHSLDRIGVIKTIWIDKELGNRFKLLYRIRI
jgi:hypothetical protein